MPSPTRQARNALSLALLAILLFACSNPAPSPSHDDTPSAPTHVTATPIAGAILVTWTDTSSTETAFRVYRETLENAPSTQAMLEIASLAADSTSYVDVNVTPGDTYLYAVVAQGKERSSPPVPQQGSAVSPQQPPPEHPRVSVLLAGDGSGTVMSSPTGIDCGITCMAAFDPGTTVTLTATADDGSSFTRWEGACSGSDACVVTLEASSGVTAVFSRLPSPPEASFVANAVEGTAPLEVAFDATGSSDAEGAVATFAWDFGDGGSASGVEATHVFTTPGRYPVRLTVTDAEGRQDTAEVEVVVGTAFGRMAQSFSGEFNFGWTMDTADGYAVVSTVQWMDTLSSGRVWLYRLQEDHWDSMGRLEGDHSGRWMGEHLAVTEDVVLELIYEPYWNTAHALMNVVVFRNRNGEATEVDVLPSTSGPTYEFRWDYTGIMDAEGSEIFLTAEYRLDDGRSYANMVFVYQVNDDGTEFLQRIDPPYYYDRRSFGSKIVADRDSLFIRGDFGLYVYAKVDQSWTLQDMVPIAAVRGLSVDGRTVAISAGDSVYIYERTDDLLWNQTARLRPTSSTSRFGDVALVGPYLAISHTHNDVAAEDAGAVHVYKLLGDGWTFVRTLFAPEPVTGSCFGWNLGLTRDWLVIGENSLYCSEAPRKGVVYFYTHELP